MLCHLFPYNNEKPPTLIRGSGKSLCDTPIKSHFVLAFRRRTFNRFETCHVYFSDILSLFSIVLPLSIITYCILNQSFGKMILCNRYWKFLNFTRPPCRSLAVCSFPTKRKTADSVKQAA